MAEWQQNNVFIQWQLIDSLLPTGGFAHSYGLEAAIQRGIVRKAAPSSSALSSLSAESVLPAAATQQPFGLVAYVMHLLEAMAASDLPFVAHTHLDPACADHEVLQATVRELDVVYGVSIASNHVLRRASVAQGSALMRLVAEGALTPSIPAQECFRTLRRADSTSGTARIQGFAAPVFGALTRVLGFSSSDAQRMFLFMTLRDLMSAAVRLSLVGPMGAQHIQTRCYPKLEAILQTYKDRPVADAHQCMPVADTAQGVHDTLYSRLFNS
jgi:urease accessory protein